MKILALDLGKFNTMCCFFDTKTRQHAFQLAATERNYLTTIFKTHKVDLVVMEACGPSGWIHDVAVSLGHKTLICSTNEDAWKWSNVKRKTDKDDALKLARMASMNELKAVHMPSEQHREFRSLVKYRKTLDNRINKMKCTIRAWFVNHGIPIDKGDTAWHTGRDHINSFRKPLIECGLEELWRGELALELTQMDALSTQLDGVVKRLEAIGKNDPRIQRIQSIPGVGPRTAEILVACLDDPKRFENGRQVSAYFGLVPRQYQSGETDRNGRITKRGNPLARTILVECAWASMRYNPWAKFIYERISGKQKTRKKKAAVALARKLAVIAWALLREDKDWDPKKMIQVTESFGKLAPELKDKLERMKPKENADQRKKRLRKERREAKSQETSTSDRKSDPLVRTEVSSKNRPNAKRKVRPGSTPGASKNPRNKKVSSTPSTKTRFPPKPRRVRKPVPVV